MLDRSWVWGVMRRSTLFLFVAVVLAIPNAVEAQMYTWKDANGGVHYSNIPHGGATSVELGSPNVIHDPNFNQSLNRKSVPYRDINGQMHVQGQVNGVTVDFVVDTGASFIVIPRVVAQQAGISTDGAPTMPMQTANGITNAPVVRIDHFVLGSLHSDGISAVVHNIDSAGRIGLLGMNFLGGYKMTIDHEHSMLVLEPR